MFKRIRKTNHKCRQAFTLVELIVVLVILAVLAGMLVPALVGYIKRSRKAKYIQMADAYRTAAQAVMAEFYGKTGGHDWPQAVNIYWYKENKNKQTGKVVDGKPWGDKVLELMGTTRGSKEEPYILIVGVGDPRDFPKGSPDIYTVYYVGYCATKNSPAIFYVNGEWIYTYPTMDPKYIDKQGTNQNIRNYILNQSGNIPIQYFIISDNTKNAGSDDCFIGTGKLDSLYKHSESYK